VPSQYFRDDRIIVTRTNDPNLTSLRIDDPVLRNSAFEIKLPLRPVVAPPRRIGNNFDDENRCWSVVPVTLTMDVFLAHHDVRLDLRALVSHDRSRPENESEAMGHDVWVENVRRESDDRLVVVRRRGVTNSSPRTNSYLLPSSGRLWTSSSVQRLVSVGMSIEFQPSNQGVGACGRGYAAPSEPSHQTRSCRRVQVHLTVRSASAPSQALMCALPS
jgi:hypothetical protein